MSLATQSAQPKPVPVSLRILAVLLAVVVAAGATAIPVQAQSKDSAPPAQQQQQQTPPAAGGPQGDVGPIALPKKKEAPPPETPKPLKNPAGTDFSVRVDVPLVNLDVLVTTNKGQFIPGLKKENFRIYEDGAPQTVTSFSQSEAPITAVLLVEFARNNYSFVYDALNASYAFASSLRPQDWIAVVTYDMQTHRLTDFTQDKRAIAEVLHQMNYGPAGMRETNLFDALYDTLDRIDGIPGRKYIVLVSTGVDTFSKLTYDDVLKKVKNTQNVGIFAVGTGQALRLWAEGRGYLNGPAGTTFLQADNQMNTFASLTGGRAYFPRFEGEMRGIFADIANSIRNQYTLSYRPTNSKQDGSYRKIKVQMVDAVNGGPMRVKDEKGKDVKFTVLTREGYRAKQVVE